MFHKHLHHSKEAIKENLPISSLLSVEVMKPLAATAAATSCCSLRKLLCLSALSRRLLRPGVTPAPSRARK